MAKLDLSIYGITDVKEILHNPHMKNCTRQKQTRNWKGTKRIFDRAWRS